MTVEFHNRALEGDFPTHVSGAKMPPTTGSPAPDAHARMLRIRLDGTEAASRRSCSSGVQREVFSSIGDRRAKAAGAKRHRCRLREAGGQRCAAAGRATMGKGIQWRRPLASGHHCSSGWLDARSAEREAPCTHFALGIMPGNSCAPPCPPLRASVRTSRDWRRREGFGHLLAIPVGGITALRLPGESCRLHDVVTAKTRFTALVSPPRSRGLYT